MNTAHQANHALLTLNAVGVKLIKSSAPCVIIGVLSAEEMMEFRSELSDAELIIAQTKKTIDRFLESELNRCRED